MLPLAIQPNCMKQVLLLFFFTATLSIFAISQTTRISGYVHATGGETPVANVTVAGPGSTTLTGDSGYFTLEISGQPETANLYFSKQGFDDLNREVAIGNREQISVGVVYLSAAGEEHAGKDAVTGEDRIPVITLSGSEDDSEPGSESISGILSASRDPFIEAAAYNLSTGGFDIRGYRSESEVLFNGIPVNNLENGSVYWSDWGGLNDVTRNRESTIDLSPTSFTFGGLGGATAFDIRASKQRVQRRFSYLFSNRSYNSRLMGTWSTGMLPSGWAFSFSASKRWAKEGYVPGTFYNAYAYFAAIDKKIGRRHLLNLTALGAPVRRGQQGAGTEEANDLAGTRFYNPNWGYQSGEKRNARVINSHQPLFILRHDWDLGGNATLTTSAGYQSGKYGRTTLDWFNAPDPRADYYRKLPSFFALENTAVAGETEQIYRDNPDLLQIQWDDLYEANRSNGKSYNGETGNWSQYAIGNEHSDAKKINANSTYQNIISDHLTVNSGITYRNEKTHYFKEMDDLLGGDYFVNLDRFGLDPGLPDDFARNDLENDNVIVRVGDTYDWNYDINNVQTSAWLQGQFSYRKVDFFLAGTASKTEFWRTGHYRNGRFPDNSSGDSEKQDYTNYGAKGGLTYKINGRNYLYANGATLSRAPNARNAYASPRKRDQIVPGLTWETVYAAEGGYLLKSPTVMARATFYYTQFKDGLKLNRFFLPGDISNFGSYILTGLDTRHQGMELALQAKVSPTLSVNGVAAVGRYVYTSRPNGVFIQDDDGLIQERGTIYIKDFFVASTPQTALSLGLDYRSPKYWSASITVNYFDGTYLDFSPERRTAEQVIGLEQGSEFYDAIVNQTKAPDAVTVDLFAYKSFKINDDVFFYLTSGVTNLLNATVVTGGYEQLRFERQDVEQTGINVFPPRRFYAYGTNFFLMGALRF